MNILKTIDIDYPRDKNMPIPGYNRIDDNTELSVLITTKVSKNKLEKYKRIIVQ